MKIKIGLYFVLAISLFLIGVCLGMLIGTYAVIDHVTKGLSGSTFTIDVNETKLVEEVNRTIIPEFESYIKLKGDTVR